MKSKSISLRNSFSFFFFFKIFLKTFWVSKNRFVSEWFPEWILILRSLSNTFFHHFHLKIRDFSIFFQFFDIFLKKICHEKFVWTLKKWFFYLHFPRWFWLFLDHPEPFFTLFHNKIHIFRFRFFEIPSFLWNSFIIWIKNHHLTWYFGWTYFIFFIF